MASFFVKPIKSSKWQMADTDLATFVSQTTAANQTRPKDKSPMFGFGFQAGTRSNTPSYMDRIVGLDYDAKDNPGVDFAMFLRDLRELPTVYAAYVTYSGGIRILCLTNAEPGDEAGYISYALSADNIVAGFRAASGKGPLVLDRSKINGKNGWYCGNRPDLVWFNPDPSPIHIIDIPAAPVPAAEEEEKKEEKPLTPIQRAAIKDALRNVSMDDYETWINVGMAMHDAGYDAQDWADVSWDDADIPTHWASFGTGKKRKITVGTLIKLIKDADPAFDLAAAAKSYYAPDLVSAREDSIHAGDKYYAAEEIIYTVRVRRGTSTRTLDMPGSVGGTLSSAQRFLRAHDVDLDLNPGRLTGLMGYLSKASRLITSVDIGHHKDMYVGADYIIKAGTTYKADNGVITVGDNHYRVNNTGSAVMMDDHPSLSGGNLSDFCKKFKKSYKNTAHDALILGWAAASLIRSDILSISNDFPILFLTGKGQNGKTTVLDIFGKIFNQNLLNDATVYQIYKYNSESVNTIVPIDEMSDTDGKGSILEMLKNISRNHKRVRLHGDRNAAMEWRNSAIISSNYPISDDAVVTRLINLQFGESHKGTREDFAELRDYVDDNRYGIFADLLGRVSKITKADLRAKIRTIVGSIRSTVDNDRVADLYAIVLAVADLTGILDILGVTVDDVVATLGGRQTNTAEDLVKQIIFDLVCDDQARVKAGTLGICLVSDPDTIKIRGADLIDFIRRGAYYGPDFCAQKWTKIIANYTYVSKSHTAAGTVYTIDRAQALGGLR